MAEDHPGTSPEPKFAAYISIDWADQKHDWAWCPTDGGPKRTGQFAHSPEAVHAWVAQVGAAFATSRSPSRWSKHAVHCCSN
jgi:hypothetical protein